MPRLRSLPLAIATSLISSFSVQTTVGATGTILPVGDAPLATDGSFCPVARESSAVPLAALSPEPGERVPPQHEQSAWGVLDGIWSLLEFSTVPSPREQLGSVFDPERNRMVIFGGFPASNDVWELSLGETPVWNQIATVGTPPSARFVHSMVYDPPRHRAIIFGGLLGSTESLLGELWSLSLAEPMTWTQMVPLGGPPSAREGCALVYDPSGDRLILFGGYDGQFLADVWSLSLTGTPTWTRLDPAGTPPLGRNHMQWAYDSNRDRLVVFGGFDGRSLLGDLWTLDLAETPAWARLTLSGFSPAPRREGVAIYDPAGDRMVIFGGLTGWNLGDTWTLSFTPTPTWTLLPKFGAVPTGRKGHAGVLDDAANRFLVFGGVGTSLSYKRDVHALMLSSPRGEWVDLTPPVPPMPSPRFGASAVLDPNANRMLVWGGDNRTGSDLNDLWALGLGSAPQWSMLQPTGVPPSPGKYALSVLDRSRNRVLLLWGATHSLSLSDPPVWSQDLPGVPAAATTETGIALIDVPNDRLIVANLWPPAVYVMSLASSPVWTTLRPGGVKPRPRIGTAAIFDSRRNRVVFFGGWEEPHPHYTNSTLVLSLGDTPTWSFLPTSGPAPSPREGHSMVYDPTRDQVIMFGGNRGIEYLNDAWVLSLHDIPTWTRLNPGGPIPIGRDRAAVVFDQLWTRLVLYGGHNRGIPLDDTRFLTWNWDPADWHTRIPAGEASMEIPSSMFGLEGTRPNPARGSMHIAFTLPDASPATLELFDLGGRRLAVRQVGVLGRGRHELQLDETSEVPAGVYLIRLTRRADSRCVRVCMIR